MPYWLDWLYRSAQFPLSKKIKNQLLSEDMVREKLRAGVNPIDISIQKWKQIQKVFNQLGNEPLPLGFLNDLSQYIGYKTCALCLSSLNEYIKQYGKINYGSDKCKVCPLARVDQCTSKKSTFHQIEEIFLNISYELTNENEEEIKSKVKDLLEKMIKNLQEIKN